MITVLKCKSYGIPKYIARIKNYSLVIAYYRLHFYINFRLHHPYCLFNLFMIIYDFKMMHTSCIITFNFCLPASETANHRNINSSNFTWSMETIVNLVTNLSMDNDIKKVIRLVAIMIVAAITAVAGGAVQLPVPL